MSYIVVDVEADGRGRIYYGTFENLILEVSKCDLDVGEQYSSEDDDIYIVPPGVVLNHFKKGKAYT